MRFILYFILSGFIYYGIYHYLPEVFTQLVSLTDTFFTYAQAFLSEVITRVQGGEKEGAEEAAKQLLPLLFVRKKS